MAQLLVVEDDERIRSALVRALREGGHAVSSAATALAGLRQAVDERPDLVVLDLGLPDLDGRELLRMLRAVSAVPVIVATARDDDDSVVRALDAGDLGAAVDALLGNVFAHTPEGTAVTVSVRRRLQGGAVVTVTDAGPGMPGAAVERGRSGDGSTGLGLDIARRTAEASGGGLRIESSPGGTAVSVELGPPPSGDQPAPQDHPLRSP